MNDPNKRIDIDKSSLLSLRAELLRKKAEVERSKSTTIIPDYVPKRPSSSTKNESKSTTDKKQPIELEDSNQLARSKRMLEAKAKYYEKMMKSGADDEGSLVMFNQKYRDSRRGSTSDEDSVDESAYPEEDWIEYTDCLGRTRKCLKKDLDRFQKRDDELQKVVEARSREQNEMKQTAVEREPTPEMTEEEKKVDDILRRPETSEDNYHREPDDIGERFIEQREQWDQQLGENLQKDFVHYQDVLFDEAREHGVGYYAFSTDEEERHRQQQELQNLHKQTMAAQKQKEDLRSKRDQIIADRVKAAKARQRARQGLPPEEEQAEPEPQPDPEAEQQKKLEEKLARKREKSEKKREIERKHHIRPWDADKGHSEEWQPRVDREPVSQDVWNEQKRSERPAEFAPPEPFYEDRKGLFFSSKTFKRKNYSSDAAGPSQPVPIQNEISDEEDEEVRKPKERTGGAQIPPPPSWDYYTPDQKRQKKTGPVDSNLESSIEAGLKYLREQSDKSQVTTKNKWVSKADY